jgi:hypothetical protein
MTRHEIPLYHTVTCSGMYDWVYVGEDGDGFSVLAVVRGLLATECAPFTIRATDSNCDVFIDLGFDKRQADLAVQIHREGR